MTKFANPTAMSRSSAVPRRLSRGGTMLAAVLSLVILAACGSSSPSPAGSTAGSIETSSLQASAETETVAPSATESDLTGTWDGTWAIDPPYETSVGEFTMELVQTGSSFDGTVEITNTDCSNGSVAGTIDGTTIDFGWALTPQPVQFEGVLSGTSMSGTWEAIACSNPDISLTGTWEATKQP